MRREIATEPLDLPHAFEPSWPRVTCGKCHRERAAELHTTLHPETAAAKVERLQREIGT